MGSGKVDPMSFTVSVVNEDGSLTPLGTLKGIESVDVVKSEQEKPEVKAIVDIFNEKSAVSFSEKLSFRTRLKLKWIIFKGRIRNRFWLKKLRWKLRVRH